MAKSKKQVLDELNKEAVELVAQQNSLLQNPEFKKFLEQKRAADNAMADFRQRVREEMIKFGIKKIVSENGKDDWQILLSETCRVGVEDISLVPDDYISLEKADNEFVVIDGQVFKKVADTKKAQGELKAHLVDDIPGLKITNSTSLRVTINGKAVS